ncbi:MAG: hypothetical protein IJV70_04330 [Clostridia bacterium]|nr:hypothetical protein [Clostridia bacterium]
MKKIINCALILGFLVCCFTTIIFAEDDTKLESKPITELEFDIEELINELLTEYQLESLTKNVKRMDETVVCTYDKSKYLLGYIVTEDFWNNVTDISFDYQCLTENSSYAIPTIYVPFWGDIADSEGNISNRQIGYIELEYEMIDEKYSSHFSISNFTSQAFKDKTYIGFYEEITDYIEQNNINATQTFLILYPYTHSNNREMIAVIQTEEDTIILDMYDTCHLTTSVNDPTIAYSVEEYRALRMEAEKTLYKELPLIEQLNNFIPLDDFLPYIIIVGTVIIFGTFFLILKKQKNCRTE